MKLILFFLFLGGIILESTLMPFPLTLLSIILISLFLDEIEVWAFLTGVILDLFVPRLIGIDSIFFLGVVLLSRRYHKKMHPGQFIFYTIFFLLIITIYSLIFYKNLNAQELFVFIAISGGLLVFVRRLFREVGNRKRLYV